MPVGLRGKRIIAARCAKELNYIMKRTYVTAVLLMLAAPLSAQAEGVKVEPLSKADVTSSGQPIELPRGHVKVITSTYEIPPGAKLPVHKHNYPRYGYMMSGQLRITNIATGKTTTFNPGDFIIESLGQWHKAESTGTDPVKLLVIDQVPNGENNTILQDKDAASAH
jgi:quercetin dioxygenase-like cupin family protein